jgi:hypothetical protein
VSIVETLVTLRVPAWFLIALAAIVVAGAAAAGAWYGLIHDTGPSDADHTARQDAEKESGMGADLRATAEECERQLGDLLRELEDLRSRIRRVDVSYAEYVQTAMDVSSAYGQASIRQLERDCAFSLDIYAQDALDAFIEAGSVWSDCTVDLNCDIHSIGPELQAHRRDAAAAIRQTGANRKGR